MSQSKKVHITPKVNENACVKNDNRWRVGHVQERNKVNLYEYDFNGTSLPDKILDITESLEIHPVPTVVQDADEDDIVDDPNYRYKPSEVVWAYGQLAPRTVGKDSYDGKWVLAIYHGTDSGIGGYWVRAITGNNISRERHLASGIQRYLGY
ncbi:hypothetical protein BDN70DRAFT_898750 [Pholiota conissans]|uniref:Uncharacterized protein n=1 Tax=Pholiota conissans TaxID=109636 RepID=A0A9P6CW03_9AGAR|nr:hypothetical protein BDN70DRAFT_898750 [Pholiota conissans]